MNILDQLSSDTCNANADLIADANKSVLSLLLRICDLDDLRLCRLLGIDDALRLHFKSQKLSSICINTDASNMTVFEPLLDQVSTLNEIADNRVDEVLKSLLSKHATDIGVQSYASILATMNEVNKKLLSLWSALAISRDPLAGVLSGVRQDVLDLYPTLPRAALLSGFQANQMPIFKLRFTELETWVSLCKKGIEDPLAQRELLKKIS